MGRVWFTLFLMGNRALGEIHVPTVWGTWGLPDFPEWVEVGGVLFRKATLFAWPYEGVEAQYREAVATNAAHLLVYENRRFKIDHLDEANPAHDPWLHYILDTVPGKKLGTGGTLVVLGLAAALAAGGVWAWRRAS